MNSIKTPFGFSAVTILCVATLGAGSLLSEAGVAPPVTNGLVLGYDGSDVTVDGGGYVTSWNDQTTGGGTHNAVAPVGGIAGNSPLLDNVNTLGGHNVLLFDGIYDSTAGDVLSTSYTPSAGVSFFTVFRRDAQTTGGSGLRTVIGANTLERTGIAVLAGATNNNVNARYNNVQVNGSGVGDGQYHVVSSIGATGTDGILLTIDGAIKATNATASDPTFSNVEIGGQDNSASRRFAGPIAEVLVYDRPLTAAERVEVEGYLGEKYGLFQSMAVPLTDLPVTNGLKAHFDADHARADAAGEVDLWMSRTMDGTRADKYGSQPSGELITGEVNGHNVVRFNPNPDGLGGGLDEILQTNYTPASGEDLTVFAVARQSGQDYGTGSSEIKVITSSGPVDSGNGVFRFANRRSNKQILEISSHGPPEYKTVSTTFSDGSFHFMTGLVDNGSNVQGFYDGERTLDEAVSGTPPVSPFQIGGDAGRLDRGFSGDIGEVIVFNRKLSAGERAQVEGYLYLKYFDQATSDPNTLGYWHFDRQAIGQSVGVDGLIVDYSGRHHHATARGGPLEVVAGESLYADDSALRFEGDADHMVVPDSDDFEFDADTDSFTIEAMIRTTMTSTGAIFCKSGGSSSEAEYWLRVKGTTGTIQNVFRDDVPIGVSCNGTKVVNDGDWHHVAIVFDAVADLMRLYVDYEVDNEVSASGLTGIIGGNGHDLRIGDLSWGGPFDGDIDFVRISGVALDSSEFLQRYVPEPSSILLLACGLAAAAGGRPRRRKRRCL